MEIFDKDKNQFANEFISQYAKVGFGAMTKNDFEVLIFHLLRQYGDLQNKSNYEISSLLKIPESKVKRLRYESSLKYSQIEDENINKQFLKLLEKARLLANGNKIQFAIEDKLLQLYINAKLKELGYYADTSFNSEIASINVDAFILLLEHIYPQEQIQEIEKCAKEICKEGEKLTFNKIIKHFLGKVGSRTVELGSDLFWKAITNVDIPQIKNNLSSFLDNIC